MIAHEGHTDDVNSIAFSPDSKSVISGSSDKTVRIWDANSSSPIGEPLQGHSSSVFSVSYSPLGNLIASGSYDNTIRLWHPSTSQQSGDILMGDHAFRSVAFSPDAKLIASGHGGPSSSPTSYAVQLWDVQTRDTSGPLTDHTNSVNSISFSPDGTRLASGSDDETIRVWDVERKSPILGPLKGHTYVVRSVAFSPDSAQIVSCSLDGTIRLWDPRTGQPIVNPFTGHTDDVYSVSFSPRGTYIASGSLDKTVRLWDVRTGRQVGQPFKEHAGWVTSVAFSPCGQFVASGSVDRKVIIRRVLGEAQCPAAGDDVEPQEIESHMEVGQDDEADGNVKPQMITSQLFIPESHKDPDSDDDIEPQMVTSQMSTQQIFECLCRAGCIDLSSQMDSQQDTAMIASGGGFGDIWKGEMHTGVKVAIKAWRTTALGRCEYKTLKRAARELHLWSRMDHPHIHRLQGVILFRHQYLGMVSEWMDNGNLHNFLLKHPEADRYQLCIHVVSGLEYMHGCSTVHGDLKALNVLVSSEGIARLSDFDFSIMSDASSLVFTASSNTRTGSVRWVAPEMIDDDTPKRTTQSDVYALGMTMLEIFTGDVPYPDRREDYAVMKVVMRGILPPRPAQYLSTDELGNRTWKLISDCWNRNPHERPSAGRVLEVLKYGAGKT
ncbi:unnamed protein product [Rhizoctonia solani]|uniref:Protein kinase domain-containing protein n=1 Tax=Rhizoctonia solani TaxID=456999 RepID=A0A8H3HTW5_9AGAM|nr:unnamed protein product [Rhizoctonia solani]